MKAEIKSALKSGMSPKVAVNKTFRKRKIREHLKNMVLDMVIKSIKMGLKGEKK
jgi:hypothetical protein